VEEIYRYQCFCNYMKSRVSVEMETYMLNKVAEALRLRGEFIHKIKMARSPCLLCNKLKLIIVGL
jgi:hypothetical protein